MKTPLHPLLCTLVIGLALAPAPVRGQIGTDIRLAVSTFGPPTGVTTNEDGDRILSFRRDGADITVAERHATAIRIVYRKRILTDADVLRWLESNRGNSDWAPWSVPGLDETATAATWLRADELAMASRNGIEFTVTTAGGKLTPESAGAPAADEPAETNAVSPPVVTSASATPPPDSPPPPSKPARPMKLPGPGETRDQVLLLLGAPTGEISRGRSRILLYPWGQVVLQDGLVISVDITKMNE